MTRSQRSTQMTVAEIVDETVQFYNEDVSRRAIDPSTNLCVYTDGRGQHCAVGRCLIDNTFNNQGSVCSVWCDSITGLDRSLKEQYRGHTLEFWSDLQELHDSKSSWDTHGVTQWGRNLASEIKDEHA